MSSWSTFTSLSTPLALTAARRLGVAARLAPPGLSAVSQGQRVAGPVRTVAFTGEAEVLLDAIADAPARAVLVVDDGGRRDAAAVGHLEVLEARASGVGAILVWGAHQDTLAIRNLKFPLFSYGASPAHPEGTSGRLKGPEGVRLGDVAVTDGDACFVDDDGAFFAPLDAVDAILELATRLAEEERGLALRLQRGGTLRSEHRGA